MPKTCRYMVSRLTACGGTSRLTCITVMVTVVLAGCSKAAPETARLIKPFTSGGSTNVPMTNPAPTVARSPTTTPPVGHHKTKMRVSSFKGDGFTSKGRNWCSNMPFPGSITTAFRMHECWEGLWHSRKHHLQDMMYMLGYKPGSRGQIQQMIVGLANGPVRVVNLRNGIGVAHLAHFGRTCGVVTYSRSSTSKTYYMPFRHAKVKHCRWRH